VQLAVGMDGITVDVTGIGPIGFPVSVAQARKLVRLGTLVHGSGWDVPRGLVSIEWDEAGLGSVLAGAPEGPGLPWQCEFNAARVPEQLARLPLVLGDLRHAALAASRDARRQRHHGGHRYPNHSPTSASKAVITIAGAGFQSANARVPSPFLNSPPFPQSSACQGFLATPP
jgi:hypothetical protein